MTIFDLEQLKISPNDKTILREFVAAWERHKYPVLFVGAGVSKFYAVRRPDIGGDSKFSSWFELLNALKDRLSNRDEEIAKRLSTDPLRLAQLFQEQFGRAALLDLIHEHVPSSDYLPGHEHELLRALPWSAIVTTNYDDLIERAFESTKRVRKIVADADLTQPRSLEDLLVVKMHGDLAARDSIVLTEEDYRQYTTNRPGISIKIRQLLTEHPLMFLGFSLSDPHFTTIDGWIRDTVGRVRLPAVSIVHSEALPAERAMWKSRGIELVELRADSLSHLLTALASERRPSHSFYGVFNQRVADLERSAYAIAQGDAPNRFELLAKTLREIVAGAGKDSDTGAAAGVAVRWFCWGWHSVFRRREDTEPAAPTDARAVFDKLSVSDRQLLLKFALKTGTGSLRIDGPSSVVDIGQELVTNNAYRLTEDERALVHLYIARIHREQGATDKARAAISVARALNPSSQIKGQLSAEARENLFQDGDLKGIEAELRRPLDEGSDVLAMCRRGADALLLRMRDEAHQWYATALERAKTGDEKYSALWGTLACQHEMLSSDPSVRQRETDLLARLRAIPEIDRPVSRRAQELVESAGDVLLDGKSYETAIDRLTEFLSEARHLGWPHSPDHNVSHRIESAARRTARLLLTGESVERGGVDQIKEGLAILSRYGLASETRKLVTDQHREVLSRVQADVEWFREFVAIRPTLPRPRDARLTAGLVGIPLLSDEGIEQIVETLIRRTDEWRDGGDAEGRELLGDWWELVMENSEHLPQGAATQVFSMLTRCCGDRRAISRIQPRNLALELWMRQVFLDKSVEGKAFVDAAAEAFKRDVSEGDPFFTRDLVACVGNAARAGVFSKSDAVGLLTVAVDALNAELAKVDRDDNRVLRLVSLIEDLDGTDLLASFAPCATAVLQKSLRASTSVLAFHCAALVARQMSTEQRQDLLHVVSEYCELPIAAAPRFFDATGAAASALAAVADVLPQHRAAIVAQLQRLCERDVSALGALGALPGLSDEVALATMKLAEKALFSTYADRRRALRGIANWLGTAAARATAEPIVDVLLGVAISDEPDTRMAALRALSSFFLAHRVAVPGLVQRAFRVATELVQHDPVSRVRVRAMSLVTTIATDDESRAIAARLVDQLSRGVMAIERRVADLARRSVS